MAATADRSSGGGTEPPGEPDPGRWSTPDGDATILERRLVELGQRLEPPEGLRLLVWEAILRSLKDSNETGTSGARPRIEGEE